MTATETSPAPRVTRVAGRPAIGLVGFAFFVTMLGATLPTPLYPAYAARYGFGEFVTTLVFAVYAAGVTVALLLLGHWSDSLGRKPMLLAGLVLSGLSAGCFLAAGPLWLLFAGRVVSGLSAGVMTGTATAAVVDLAPASGRSRAGLVAVAVNTGGLGVGPLVAGVLAEHARSPLRLCFVVDLVLVALAAVAVAAVRDPVERSATPNLRPRRLAVPDDIRATFVRAAIAGFAGFAVLGLFTAVSPAFLGTVLHHHSPTLVGLTVLAVFAASVAGQVVSGRLAAATALTAGCAALVVGMVVLGVALAAHSLPVLLAGGAVAGFGQGLSFRSGTSAVTSGVDESQRGAVTSTLFVVLYVGISIPVIGVGALATGIGLVPAGMVFAGLVAILAAAALVLVRRYAA